MHIVPHYMHEVDILDDTKIPPCGQDSEGGGAVPISQSHIDLGEPAIHTRTKTI